MRHYFLIAPRNIEYMFTTMRISRDTRLKTGCNETQ
jgi:hypothetical protein